MTGKDFLEKYAFYGMHRYLNNEERDQIVAALNRPLLEAVPAQRAEAVPQFVKIGILHRRRTGDVDFLQEAEVIPLGLHETLDVYATSQSMNKGEST